MPTYEYRCPDGHDFEHFVQKISEASSELPCPVCGKLAARRMSAGAGLVFKGSGFYITDYGKDGKKDQRDRAEKEKTAAVTGSTGDSAKGEGTKAESPKGEGAKAEGAKSDAKAERSSTEGAKTESKGDSAKGTSKEGATKGDAKSGSAKPSAPPAPPKGGGKE